MVSYRLASCNLDQHCICLVALNESSLRVLCVFVSVARPSFRVAPPSVLVIPRFRARLSFYRASVTTRQLTKHIQVQYHFVRERVLSGEVELVHVVTDGQIADIFATPLGLDKLREFFSVLGLQHLDIPNLWGRNSERSEEIEKPNLMKRSISGRCKKPKKDTGEATKGTSSSGKQPIRREVKPRR